MSDPPPEGGSKFAEQISGRGQFRNLELTGVLNFESARRGICDRMPPMRSDVFGHFCAASKSLNSDSAGSNPSAHTSPISCPAAKLIVELDGDQHGSDRQQQYDAARTRWLEARGYWVLRFSNSERGG